VVAAGEHRELDIDDAKPFRERLADGETVVLHINPTALLFGNSSLWQGPQARCARWFFAEER
jgi:hypothetical protein